MARIQIGSIPNCWSACSVEKWCCYRSEDGMCDTPRTNKGNSDAACHKMGNAALLKKLEVGYVDHA